MKRTVASSTVAIRSIASDMSSILATLVIGTVVDQIDASAGWVRIVTDDERRGWLRETDLGPIAEAPQPTLAQERQELSSEIQAVEQTQLGTLVNQIEQVVQAKQTEANRAPTGWQFDPETTAAAILQNYTFHALGSMFLYTFMWVPA